MGVCWIVLKVGIVDRMRCTVGVVTALPVMLLFFPLLLNCIIACSMAYLFIFLCK